MPWLKWVFLGGLFLQAATSVASTDTSVRVLRAYGPGGPHHVLQECADLFRQRSGVDVAIIKALPHDLARKLPEDGDLYYGGAEYMLEEFDRLNPGVLNVSTAERLHPRRIGIIVRKGNPLNIRGVEELSQQGVDLLDVKLENMRHFHTNPADGLGNVRHLEYTGRQGLTAWLTRPELDAWVTYKSWHMLLEEDADFIEIPGADALRYIPLALTERTLYRQEALDFIAFLKSEEVRKIFVEHGWE